MSRNVIIDNFIKFQMPQTWNSVKEQPNERVLSFLCSIINTHISIFIMQVNQLNACFLIIAGTRNKFSVCFRWTPNSLTY